MLERYSTPEIQKIWSLENQYQTWLDVEISVCESWAKFGLIPQTDFKKIQTEASFNVQRIAELEQETRHDLIAFTRCVSESLGEEKKWLHYGLTSTDVVDTAQALRLRQANQLIRQDLENYIAQLKALTLKYKGTVTIGRTHGIQAEPTTFGLKMARFYQEAIRNLERFNRTSTALETGKLSGAVGNFANIPLEVEEDSLKRLGLSPQPVCSQVLPRDLYADYISSLALIASGLENLALELRSLARSEIHEVEEGFRIGQKGSSAMPHKRNPIGLENISGLSRLVRSYIIPALEDIPLWHERDISHSSVERIILPESSSLTDYMLRRMTCILKNLKVFPETMLANLNHSYGLIYSQRILLKLIDQGLSREVAYDTIQPLTARAWDEQLQFRELVEKDKFISSKLSPEEIEDAFDYHYYLKNINKIYQRLEL